MNDVKKKNHGTHGKTPCVKIPKENVKKEKPHVPNMYACEKCVQHDKCLKAVCKVPHTNDVIIHIINIAAVSMVLRDLDCCVTETHGSLVQALTIFEHFSAGLMVLSETEWAEIDCVCHTCLSASLYD